MEELTKAHKGRIAIRAFKTVADALALRGYYKPGGTSGQTLADALRTLSPEIYGTMNDLRSIELKGLEYVLDRLPRGIEECSRIVMTAQEELDQTSFEKIEPPKRRRISYRVNAREMCFVITRGLSEIYDILTHITFLYIEASKIHRQMLDNSGSAACEWRELEKILPHADNLHAEQLDQALWNLSILLGRTYQETKATFEHLAARQQECDSNRGLFHIVHQLGCRIAEEKQSRENELLVYFTPSLMDMIGHHKYGERWADEIFCRLHTLGLHERPVHIISANLHSVLNCLYACAAVKHSGAKRIPRDFYRFMQTVRDKRELVHKFAGRHGFFELADQSGTHINCQIIDTIQLVKLAFHSSLKFDINRIREEKPVLLVMDYAFGAQAFEVMDELLQPVNGKGSVPRPEIRSISIMGKAGILPGRKGDIMLASAHVMEGSAHNYIVPNDLTQEDFDADANVFTGPMVTVLGTSLQNRDVLRKFQATSWNAVGLEMEGGHYQRAINAAIIRGHLAADTKLRYAYYASDNPLLSGQTLASGGMGDEGIRPTYMITKTILNKILA